MKRPRTTIWHDDAGAVTVDWVVLAAAIVGLALLALMPVAYSSDSMARQVAGMLEALDVGYGSD